MNNQELKAQVEELMIENAKLKATKAAPALSFKIATKGGVSVYGLGRWPTTLYREQWLRLIDRIDSLVEFLTVNEDQCATKANPRIPQDEALAPRPTARERAISELMSQSDDTMSATDIRRLLAQQQAASIDE